MLVLSRKENERIVFPQLGITISLLSLARKQARVGIEAPREVSIVRGELEEEERARFATTALDEESHRERNLMNTINLHAMLYRQQVDAGLNELAARTLMKLIDFLDIQGREGNLQFDVEQPERLMEGHVMVVEDDREQCNLLESVLSMHGLHISTHTCGSDALDDLRGGNDAAVVLMDWSMGRFGGQWLSTRVAEEFGIERPKLFVLSGGSECPFHTSGVRGCLAVQAAEPRTTNHAFASHRHGRRLSEKKIRNAPRRGGRGAFSCALSQRMMKLDRSVEVECGVGLRRGS